MNNILNLNGILVNKSNIEYSYTIQGEWEKYFKGDKLLVEYSFDVSAVPLSILVIPFICNYLPLMWLQNATIYVDEIDKEFLENIELIRSGYATMYQTLHFSGKIQYNNAKNNTVGRNIKGAAVFFSGGVDAYTTLYKHLEEKPILVTLWGADLKLRDEEGWKNILSHVSRVSKDYGLQYTTIKSNFREILNERLLNQLVSSTRDGWWHAFQHGIAMISYMAPIAYQYNLQTAYIASSFPKWMLGHITCASDPSIDNHMKYCGCSTVHDGIEFDRQGKVKYILNKNMELKKPLILRVCFFSSKGVNCCRCEKCYRTILEIVSEGYNPNNYGFVWNEEAIKQCEHDLKREISIPQFYVDQFYIEIQKRFMENRNIISEYEKYQWLINMNFSRFNEYKLKKLNKSFWGRGMKKIIRILKG